MFLVSACGEALTTEADNAGDPVVADGGVATYNTAAGVSPVKRDPQQLLGLSADSILQTLGDPSIVRRDGAAEVWQYRAEKCVLDLFLYGEGMRVEHVDFRDRGGGSAGAVQACFDDMLKAASEASR